MKRLHNLDQSKPLAEQVADFLTLEAKSLPIDLGGTLVLTPTSGAARRIRYALAKEGVLAPRFSQAMRALLPKGETFASAMEQEAAWATVIKEAKTATLYSLFGDNIPASENELLKAGGVLRDLCNLLAEAALDLHTIEIPESDFDDSSRWQSLHSLYAQYLSALDKWELKDPNDERIKHIQNPDVSIQRLVIACIPDLPQAMQLFAERLIENGVTVDLLIWQPGHTKRMFDEWGRPNPQAWSEHIIEMQPEVIKQVKEPIEETRLVVDFALRAAPTGDYAIVMGDPNLGNAFKTEFWSRGGTAFLPEGERLLHSEAAILLLEWESFRKSHDLRTLRRLLEIPAFAQWLDTNNDRPQAIALSACDALLSQSVVATLKQGRAVTAVPLPKNARPAEKKARREGRALLAAVQSYIQVTGLQLLSILCEEGMLKTSDASERVLEIGNNLHQSPVFQEWDDGIMPSFVRALRDEQLPKPPSAGAVEINGWLEAPWLEAGRLALCGLIEGCLPSTLDGHPFLPDSLRSELGLTDNAARFARDAYLLDCLLHTRAPGELQCFSSKFDSSGNPNRPSRLLLSCHSNELPKRTLQLTGKVSSIAKRPLRQNNWLWQLPVSTIPKVEKITPTQFKDYLACPFRFCLKHVLKLDAFTPSAREMDAAAFGIIMHSALENFGKQAIGMGEKMLEMKEDIIKKYVLDAFTEIVHARFGGQPAPAVRIQIENARTRLIAFARVQADIFKEGWMIIDAEKKLNADAETGLNIGPLKLSGIIDRIDYHPQTGAWRIMDYKTFSSDGSPANKHLGSISHKWMQRDAIELNIGKRRYSKTWKDLQLPLYRFILGHLKRDQLNGKEPTTAYFILPSDPYQTGIQEFTELTSGMNPKAYNSSLSCAAEVAENVAAGVFWPPQPFRGSWDDPFAALLINGKPEASISPESIKILKGSESS